MSELPTRWSTAAGMAWWKKLLIVIAIVVGYLLLIALVGPGHSCSGPTSGGC